MKRRNLPQEILNQEVVCGGVLLTRGVLYQQLLAEGQPAACVDLFVMCLPTEHPTQSERAYYAEVRAALDRTAQPDQK